LRSTPRPVKTLRAAPTAKWENIAIVKAVQAAVCPLNTRNGATGMNAPIAVDAPVSHPSLNGVAWASPIFSSSRTCSSRARCESRQRLGMCSRLLGELERYLPRVVEADLLVEVHVPLHLLPLLA